MTLRVELKTVFTILGLTERNITGGNLPNKNAPTSNKLVHCSKTSELRPRPSFLRFAKTVRITPNIDCADPQRLGFKRATIEYPMSRKAVPTFDTLPSRFTVLVQNDSLLVPQMSSSFKGPEE